MPYNHRNPSLSIKHEKKKILTKNILHLRSQTSFVYRSNWSLLSRKSNLPLERFSFLFYIWTWGKADRKARLWSAVSVVKVPEWLCLSFLHMDKRRGCQGDFLSFSSNFFVCRVETFHYNMAVLKPYALQMTNRGSHGYQNRMPTVL